MRQRQDELTRLNRRGRRELAMRLRYDLNWPLRRIAARLDIGLPAVSRLLKRAVAEKRGVVPSPSPRRAAPVRTIRPVSLATVFQA
jgi:DNA-binding Lrp family transcriptional regulator